MNSLPNTLTALFLAVASGATQAQSPLNIPRKEAPLSNRNPPPQGVTNPVLMPPPTTDIREIGTKVGRGLDKSGVGTTCPVGPAPTPATDASNYAVTKDEKHFETVVGVDCPRPAPSPATSTTLSTNTDAKPPAARSFELKDEKK